MKQRKRCSWNLVLVALLAPGLLLTACGAEPTPTPVPPAEVVLAPTDTPVPPTDTPVPPTDTPLPPTDTPAPPTPTPPIEMVIPGWEKFEGGGVELWLPASYDGGDLSEDLEVVVENLRRLGPDFEQMAQIIEQNPSMYVIWAFDSEVGASGFLSNVAVTTERVVSAVTLDTYLDAALSQFPEQFQVQERDIVTLGETQAGRVVIEFVIQGVSGKEILYAVKDGTTMWVITYATGAAEFDERLPVFEQSAATFTIQP